MISPPSGPRIARDIAGECPSASKSARGPGTRLFLLERSQESSFEDSFSARDKADRYRIHPGSARCNCHGDSHLSENIFWTIFQSRHLRGGSIQGEHEIVPGLCLPLYAPSRR